LMGFLLMAECYHNLGEWGMDKSSGVGYWIGTWVNGELWVFALRPARCGFTHHAGLQGGGLHVTSRWQIQ
jgi:hypothetical protein